ncbi:MAG: DUF4179 domain-containing protein [Oscillospiraceae bacterium]|nr:DUF4179 domain-containing protein [Oscillospiraceae bacterium]
MTPEKLLEAMTDLEDYDIMTAKKQTPRRRAGTRKFVVLVAAVVAMMAMTVTAFAAVSGAAWFKDFFRQETAEQLTQGQLTYIDDNTKDIGQSVTQNGYTMTLESALSDGYVAYIKLKFEGPEGTVLDADQYFPTYKKRNFLYATDGRTVSLVGRWDMMDDGDAQDNAVSILFTWAGSGFGDDVAWKLELEDIYAVYDREDGSSEEKMVAEGLWSFDLIFSDLSGEEVEFVSEPFAYHEEVQLSETETYYFDFQITSLKLRPLSAVIYKRRLDGNVPELFSEMIVVMKDGSTVSMHGHTGSEEITECILDAPIDLDEVDYILFPNGTTIPMP